MAIVCHSQSDHDPQEDLARFGLQDKYVTSFPKIYFFGVFWLLTSNEYRSLTIFPIFWGIMAIEVMAIENHLYNQMILAFNILIYHFGYIHSLTLHDSQFHMFS
jgi:hypothetical protein